MGGRQNDHHLSEVTITILVNGGKHLLAIFMRQETTDNSYSGGLYYSHHMSSE